MQGVIQNEVRALASALLKYLIVMLEELKALQEKMNKAREEAFEKYEKMYNEYCNKIFRENRIL